MRTLNPDTGEIVVLALEDTRKIAIEIIDSVKDDLEVIELPTPERVDGDWLLEALW